MPRRVYITQIQQAHTTALPLGNTSGTFDPSVRSSVVSFFRSCRAFRHPSNKTAAINVTVKLCCVADPFNRSCPLITGAPLFYRAKLLWRGVDQRRDEWRTSNLISIGGTGPRTWNAAETNRLSVTTAISGSCVSSPANSLQGKTQDATPAYSVRRNTEKVNSPQLTLSFSLYSYMTMYHELWNKILLWLISS